MNISDDSVNQFEFWLLRRGCHVGPEKIFQARDRLVELCVYPHVDRLLHIIEYFKCSYASK